VAGAGRAGDAGPRAPPARGGGGCRAEAAGPSVPRPTQIKRCAGHGDLGLTGGGAEWQRCLDLLEGGGAGGERSVEMAATRVIYCSWMILLIRID
jgi:hypothetical protein